jgi:hypothetical protein
MQKKDTVDLSQALFIVPVGMAIDCTFLYIWRTLPRFALIDRLSFHKKLVTLTALCLLSWFVLATCAELSIAAVTRNRLVPIEAIGVSFFVVSTLCGVAVVVLQPLPDPKAAKPVRKRTYFFRSLAAAAAIGASVLLASLDSSLGGIFSTFPAIFVTTCVSLTLSHGGFEVSNGSTGPLILGCQSVSGYAMLFALLHPALVEALGRASPAAATALAVPLCWLLAVLGVSLPVFLFLRFLKRRQSTTTSGVELAQQAMLDNFDDDDDDDDDETKVEIANQSIRI